MSNRWNMFSQEVRAERQRCRDYGLNKVNERLPTTSYKAQALRELARNMELQEAVHDLEHTVNKQIDQIEQLETDLDIITRKVMDMLMDYDALERTIAAAREAAKTAPGPNGGRYVGRRFDKKTQETEFLDLGTDDSGVTDVTFKDVDVLCQCKPDKVYPFGFAKRWIREDGTVDRTFLRAAPKDEPPPGPGDEA